MDDRLVVIRCLLYGDLTLAISVIFSLPITLTLWCVELDNRMSYSRRSLEFHLFLLLVVCAGCSKLQNSDPVEVGTSQLPTLPAGWEE
nr:hypothetical protein [Mariniblastus sp.]